MSAKQWGDAIPRVQWVPEMDADVWFVGDHPIMPVGFSVIEKGAKSVLEKSIARYIAAVEGKRGY